MIYDQTDLELLRQCGSDCGGPVNWTLDDYLSMAHCDYVLRFRRGGDARVRMRLLIRKAQGCYRRERGDISMCPWNDDYERKPMQEVKPSYEADLRQAPPANVKDFIVDYLERNGRRKRSDIVEAMTARRYSTDTIDEALGALVVDNKIHREAWGLYSVGGKKIRDRSKPADADEAEETQETADA